MYFSTQGKKTPQDAVMSGGRPYVLKVLQATFYPIKTAPLQRVLSYCAYSLTKSTLVVVGALQKQSPKLLNLILHKKTISDASMIMKIWVFVPDEQFSSVDYEIACLC